MKQHYMTGVQKENTSCNLCGNNNARLLCTNYDRIHNIDDIFNIVQCNCCSLIYVNPRPTQESIVRYYPNNYAPYQQSLREGQINGDNFIKRVVKALYRLVILKPLLNCVEVKNTILPSIYRVNRETKLLDIGCATGQFLRKYREKFGCSVYGVEIDEDAANYARDHNGIEIYNTDFLANNLPSAFFDCITMWWFLEHTHNPREVLKETWRILNNDGVAVIGVPNAKSIGRYLFRDKWYGYDTPRHLYIFSPRTIRQLLQEAGFKVIAVKHDFSTWDLMGSLQYLLFRQKYLVRKKVHNIQGNRVAQLLMMPLGLLQGILKISGIIVVYAQKIQNSGGEIDSGIKTQDGQKRGLT